MTSKHLDQRLKSVFIYDFQRALNNTDNIFSAFDKQRNSSQDFNVFDVLNILEDIGRDVANKTGNTTVTASTNKICK
jgi:hypothetical protein